MVKKDDMEIQKALSVKGGRLGQYQELIVGKRGLGNFILYELITALAGRMPGALGLYLRARLYPRILGYAGRGVLFGRDVVLRHPWKIFIDDGAVIDDGCVLDAKGDANRGIFIGREAFIGRHSMLFCKNGDIILGEKVNIGFNAMIYSASEVRIGDSALIAAYSYLVGGTHHFEDPTIPVLEQKRSSRGIQVGPGGWIGAHVTIFDGVHIGKHVVIGAGSAVHRRLPDYCVAAGNPVTIINRRRVEEEPVRHLSVTVGIINYNGAGVLKEALESVQKQDADIHEIILVDNESTDDSVRFVQKRFPNVRIISMKNRGPNPARNRILREAGTDLVLLMDNDIVLDPDYVSRLEAVLRDRPDAGAVSGRICWYDHPDSLQYSGAHIHFAGAASQNRLMLPRPLEVGVVPAGAVMVRRQAAMQIEGFDEDFFYGWADGDFAFRMTLAGFSCLFDAQARVLHRKVKKGMPWVRYQVRNRWWFILKTYRFRTLILTFPAVVLYQTAVGVYLILKGHFLDYCRGCLDVWSSLGMIRKKRKFVMKMRVVSDRQVLGSRSIDLLGDTSGSNWVQPFVIFFNGLLRLYWFMIKSFVN
ncbi:MAG TPA: glycosyltransferase [bacterium]|nr:glycosyltransferase [bacterium]